jgi:uncharacterized FlaG/YvyC family protein
MGEVIILAEWKQKKEEEELQLLEQELDELMKFLNVQRQFFMFDTWGSPVLIHSEGV